MNNEKDAIRIELDRAVADIKFIESCDPIESKMLYQSTMRLIHSRISLVQTYVEYCKE
jgi:hypothetical protein